MKNKEINVAIDAAKNDNGDYTSISITISGNDNELSNTLLPKIHNFIVSTLNDEVKSEKPVLPKKWELIKGKTYWYIGNSSKILDVIGGEYPPERDINSLPSKEVAENMLALSQLLVMRDVYRNGWKPNWNDYDAKYCIIPVKNIFKIILYRVFREDYLMNIYIKKMNIFNHLDYAKQKHN